MQILTFQIVAKGIQRGTILKSQDSTSQAGLHRASHRNSVTLSTRYIQNAKRWCLVLDLCEAEGLGLDVGGGVLLAVGLAAVETMSTC